MELYCEHETETPKRKFQYMIMDPSQYNYDDEQYYEDNMDDMDFDKMRQMSSVMPSTVLPGVGSTLSEQM